MHSAFITQYGTRNVVFAAASFGVSFIRLTAIGLLCTFMLVTGTYDVRVLTAVIILVMLLDQVDGALFAQSSLNSVKSWRIRRRLTDSLTDRIVTHLGCLSLLALDLAFLPLYVVILMREVAISGYCAMCFSRGVLVYPRTQAKIAAAFVGLTVIAYTALSTPWAWIVASIMLVLSVFSFQEYHNRAPLVTVLKREKSTGSTCIVEVF